VEVGVFRTGVGHFVREFQVGHGVALNPSWCQKTSVITHSCGVKIYGSMVFVYKARV